MNFLGKILSAEDLVNKRYVDEAIPTNISELFNDAGYITGIDKSMVASAVGASGNAGKVLSSTGGDLGWVSLPTSLPASDVYAWAKKSSLALADVPDLSSKYLSVNGGTINGTTTDPIIVNTSATSVGVRLQINKVNKAYVGYGSSVGAYLYNYDTGAYIGVDMSGSPFYHNGTIKTPLIHSGNIGSQFVEGLGTAYANQSINFGREGKVRMIFGTATNSTDLGYPRQYTAGLSVVTGYTGWQMVTYGGSLLPNPYFRKLVDDGTWSDWKQLAFLDDNVASAQALTHSNGTVGATVNSSGTVTGVRSVDFGSNNLYDVGSNSRQARYIYAGWFGSKTGENLSFGANNGTHMFINSSGNVTIGGSDLAGTTYKISVDGKVHIRATTGAAMTEGSGSLIVGNGAVLMIDANNIQAKTNGTTAGPLYINDWGGNVILCGKNNGNVLIGTTSDSGYKLDVNGNSRINGNLVVAGDTSTGSDIRFKDKLFDHRIALESIAQAPLFTFKWNDREDKAEHLGSSAQYWEKVAPWLVKGEDFKTLDYSTLGVAIGISLANKTLNHEERIKILERENKQLKEQIRRIQYGS